MSGDEGADVDMQGMGGMGGMGGDGESDEEMGGYTDPDALPEGITKEIVKEAGPDGWKKPKDGDEVVVHYVGTLASDGSEFDSSRSRNKEFSFMLGEGQVIKGWDLGVKTMKKGEIAKFTLAPEFAYGKAGSPPKIPEDATLVFEVELQSWVSKDDLFNDGGVIKAEVTEGSGWKNPKDGDEVKLSLKVADKEGNAIDEKAGIEYSVGSDALGPLSKSVNKALTGMKKGEVAQLTCTEEYAYGSDRPGGAVLELTLEQIFETKDISFGKDKTLMAKVVVEGEGWDKAKDTANVKLSVEAATDGEASLPGFTSQVLEFVCGNGEVCDALELAAAELKLKERAILTCTVPALCVEDKLGLKSISAAKVVLTVELQEFEKVKETYSMSEEEKVEFGAARKEVGSTLFKQGRINMALGRYKKVIDMFSYIDNFQEENKKKAKDSKKACQLNQAACQLKVQDYSEAKSTCNAILKDDANNVKAMFRRAQADLGLKNFEDCMRDCKKVVELDPQNKEARALYKSAQAGQKEVDKQAKGMFAKMCAGLGKGKIPEPGNSKDPRGVPDDYSDEEDGDTKMKAGDAKADDAQDAASGAKEGGSEEAKPEGGEKADATA